MNIKTKSALYGIIAVIAVVSINFIVLYILNFPLMAIEIIKQYWFLLVLLISGFGFQVGLFTYYNSLNAISCSTSAVSGGISGVSMILCCSHYLVNIFPFLGAIVGMSALTALSKYTLHFLILGVVSNAIGISVIFYQKDKFAKKKK